MGRGPGRVWGRDVRCQSEEAGPALPSASRALGVQSLCCEEEDGRAHGACPRTRGQGLGSCWGAAQWDRGGAQV